MMLSVWRFLISTQLWLVLALWGALYVWRPWVLGFYYDDWGFIVECVYHGGPFSYERLVWLWDFLFTRPLLFLPHFLFSSLLGTSPFLWHAGIILVILGCSVVYYFFVRELLRLFDVKCNLAAILAACLWLCAPWLAGVAAWPTMFTGYVVTALFAGSGLTLIRSWQRGDSAVFWPALLCLASLTIYEVYSFQYELLFALGAASGAFKGISRRKLLFSFVSVSLAQGLAILFKLIYPFHNPVPYWPKVFWSSFSHLHGTLLKSTYLIFKPVLIVALILLLVLAVWAVIRKASLVAYAAERRELIQRVAAYVGICLLGVVLAIFVLAFGGRYIKSLGTFGRTTIAVSYWLFALLAFAFAWTQSLSAVRLRYLAAGGGAIAIAAMSVATVWRTGDFVEAWRIEQQVAQKAPIAEIRKTDRNAVILFNGPVEQNSVYVIYGLYTISGIMNHYYPDLRQSEAMRDEGRPNGWKLFLVHGDYDTIWDGRTVTQRTTSFQASQLWFWDYYTGRFTRVNSPARFPAKDIRMP